MKAIFRSVSTSLPLILLVALGLRLGFAWYEHRIIPEQVLRAVPFLYEPGNIAYSLAIGHGFGSPFRENTGPTAWEAPVYPLLVAGFFRIFGTYAFAAFLAAISLNILCSVLVCVPLYYVGKRMGGLAVAAGATWLWAIFPNAVIVPFEWIWDTSLSALLVSTILWATLELAESRRTWPWCAYGLLWGFVLMVNPTIASVLPFLIGWIAFRFHQQEREWLGKALLTVGIAALCCVPWTIRNYSVFHTLVPIRSAMGMEMWLGNNEKYTDRSPVWMHPIDNPDERAKYVRMGEIAYMREKRDEAIHFMLTHPRREAHMIWKRFVSLWIGTPTPFADFLASPSLLIRAIFICNFLVALGAVMGIAILIRYRSIHAFPVAVFPIIFPAVYYLTLALLRYRHPIDPIVLLLTAVTLNEISRRFALPSGSRTRSSAICDKVSA